ncbi:hypothetical protein [Streptomyces corynorhini]|uniref:Uncharacterized protein n=1 Tax=Streptomyces corynorhini TaxID=2282652 RepID=A0A370B813_9ACTN|nr:hypothetical protein [Streptomyces corynorhini]RDG37940.1 hypothetical protein DVH02_11495 [Streptomyces corynorhini]
MSTYTEALAAARTVGAAHARDEQEMALFCAGPLQTLAGAVSPQLVWEGAQRRGLTTQDLAALCARDKAAVADLQW